MKLKYYIRGIGIGIIFSTLIFSVALNLNKNSLSNEEVMEKAKKLGMVRWDDSNLNSSQEVTMDDLIKPNSQEEEKPLVEEVKMTEPLVEEPMTEETISVEPLPGEKLSEEPTVDLIIEDELPTEVKQLPNSLGDDGLNVEEPIIEEPAMEEPSLEDPVLQEPIIEEPIIEEPIIEEPIIEEPVVDSRDPATIYIKSGMNSYEVAKLLKEEGLIEDTKKYDEFLKKNGYSRSIRTGSFRIPFDLSDEEMAKILIRD